MYVELKMKHDSNVLHHSFQQFKKTENCKGCVYAMIQDWDKAVTVADFENYAECYIVLNRVLFPLPNESLDQSLSDQGT